MLLRKFCGIEKTDNGYLIHGDAGDIKLVFMTDDIIRIRVSLIANSRRLLMHLLQLRGRMSWMNCFKRNAPGFRRKMLYAKKRKMR